MSLKADCVPRDGGGSGTEGTCHSQDPDGSERKKDQCTLDLCSMGKPSSVLSSHLRDRRGWIKGCHRNEDWLKECLEDDTVRTEKGGQGCPAQSPGGRETQLDKEAAWVLS